MQYYPLASGSSGNALLIVEDATAVLIDAGIGPRVLARRLQPFGLGLADLAAVFLTHEHSDHIQAFAAVTFPKTLPIICNAPTMQAVCCRIPKAELHPYREQKTGSSYSIGSLSFQSMPISHDGEEPVGYLVYGRGGDCLLLATDLGYPAAWLPAALKEADYVLLEANHDPELLRSGPYPWYLKQRVSGEQGHLSNLQAGQLLAECLTPRTRELTLAHLSKINNRPQLALQTVATLLQAGGLDLQQLKMAAAAP